jgi:ankyrin repeat protein
MSPRISPPTRTLRQRPDLDQLKRQAKELLAAFTTGEAAAAAEVAAHYAGADPQTFALHDAQLVLARAYGFASWPKLKAFVDGVTVARLAEAVRAGDLETVRSMLAARPELVHVDAAENDEHKALHVAVLSRQPAMVRLLMQHGADARRGIWPHRDATSALTLAWDRGDDEIVRIIHEEEAHRGSTPPASIGTQRFAELAAAFDASDEAAIIAILDAHPDLLRMTDREGRTALHWAAARLLPRLAAWLLGRGADPHARTAAGATPLDLAGHDCDADGRDTSRLVSAFGELLRAGEGQRTALRAIAAGDADWLRQRHAEGRLAHERGLITHAIKVDRPEMLRLLLELGLDPDEAGRVADLDEVVPTLGGPLRECALAGRLDMAAILLDHGANPNTNVYAASSALFVACERGDDAMIALLERHGARLDPVAVAARGLVDRAEGLLAEADAGTIDQVARDLLWGAIGSPSPAIVRLALARITWARSDRQWHGILENGLYLGPKSDRRRHLDAFALVLDRCDPDVRSRLGATILHDIAASRGGLTADDRVAYATLMLDAGARLDLRDTLLRSTPLGWACRWGRVELVRLLLERGADPIEPDAEPWTRPRVWAEKRGHANVIAALG